MEILFSCTAAVVGAYGIAVLLVMFIVLGMFASFSFEKVPFDVVEAESELIDGITTEFEGYGFSLIYAAEVLVGFLFIKIFCGTLGFVIFSALFPIILGLFVGRVFLARFLMTDVLEISVSTGLFLSLIILVVFLGSLNGWMPSSHLILTF